MNESVSRKRRRRILTVLLSAAGLVGLVALSWCLPLQPRKLFNDPTSAVLYGSDGTLLGARTASDRQWRFPPSDSVPEKFRKAIITYEDKRFYRHTGIDPLAVGRAIKLNLSSGSVKSGASTITMQVIRLSRKGKQRNMGEKFVEALLAVRLEIRCSKDEILTLYASNAPFGGNVVGLEAASRRYFGRPSGELSWAESATLAVLPNSPALIHPGKNREALLRKRNFLIDRLCENGTIDLEEASLAKDEPLPQKPCPMPDLCSHYLETLRTQKGDGIHKSSIDPQLQERVISITDRYAETYRTNEVYNMAAVVLDVKTGEPLAYCGNINRPDGSHGEDVDVVRKRRSSGSTLKPFLYAAMLDEGEILPGMLAADIPFHYKGFAPNNFNHTFEGAVPASDVIRRSLNVPAVRMLQSYGIEKFIAKLEKSGFTTITRGADVYGLSLILGGAEITLWDLAHAYRNLALTLEDGCPDRAYSPGAVWTLMETLTEVGRPEEEGDWHSFSSSRKVAWKTGTSYGNRDGWSVGVTPDYVVAVWVGNCNNEGRPLLTGVGYAAPVLFDIFSSLPRTGWFTMPADDLQEVVVCRESGHPASAICPLTDTITGPKTILKMEPCPYHRIVHLSRDRKWRVDSNCCPVNEMTSEPWFVLPPAQEWYYMRSHGNYAALPPTHPDMAANVAEDSPQIIYPQNGMTVATPLSIDGKSRGAVFSAAHNDRSTTLYWHIDGKYIGCTSHAEHKINVIPAKGEHILTVIDNNGNRASVRFSAK